MRSTATKMKKSKGYDLAQGSQAESKSTAQVRSAALNKKQDWAADFVIGALLYSLVASSQNGILSEMIPRNDLQ